MSLDCSITILEVNRCRWKQPWGSVERFCEYKKISKHEMEEEHFMCKESCYGLNLFYPLRSDGCFGLWSHNVWGGRTFNRWDLVGTNEIAEGRWLSKAISTHLMVLVRVSCLIQSSLAFNIAIWSLLIHVDIIMSSTMPCHSQEAQTAAGTCTLEPLELGWIPLPLFKNNKIHKHRCFVGTNKRLPF